MRVFALLLALLALSATAAEDPNKTGTLIDFRLDVQKSVPNDLGRASAYVEATGSDPSEVARKVKAALAEGLALAKAQTGITVKSGATHTTPIYGRNSRNIENWRMRSELLLESRDAALLSATLGKLQATLAIGTLQFVPAAETRRTAEEEATLEAVEAFKAKAERIASAMRKPYRIRHMNLNGSSHFPAPYAMARGAMALAAESAPMPVEAGESTVTINVSGQIELLD